MNKQDWAYVAGFFDGEGYIGLAKNKRKYRDNTDNCYWSLNIMISNTDIRVIKHLQNLLGGFTSLKTIPASPKGKLHKPQHNFYTLTIKKKEHRLAFIKGILPYAIIKKDQLILALAYIAYMEKNGHIGGRRLTQEEFVIRNDFYLKFRNLKGFYPNESEGDE